MRKKMIGISLGIIIGLALLIYGYYIYFVIGGKILIVESNPQKGFNYEYYLFIPRGADESKIKYMLVEPNNGGRISDDHRIHQSDAVNLIKFGVCHRIARKLKIPLLVPTFDRPASTPEMYTHALDRDTLKNNEGKLARIDLQLISMIKDAQQRLKNTGIMVDDRIFMNGFSASGSFVNRFTVLHPNIVKAVAAGGLNCMPILPLSSRDGENLIYPIGISDIEKRAKIKFNLDEYKKVPQYIYMGYMDDNDTLPYNDAFDDEERKIIRSFLGTRMKDRWDKSKNILKEIGIPAQMVMYNGIGHEIKSKMINDLINFFKANTKNTITYIKPYKYSFIEYKELEQVHIKAVYWNGDKKIPKHVTPNKNQFIILIEEWIPSRSYKQFDEFITNLPSESTEFTLKADGKRDVKCSIAGNFSSDDGEYQGYYLELSEEDLNRIEIGTPYKISVKSYSKKYSWIVSNELRVVRTAK